MASRGLILILSLFVLLEFCHARITPIDIIDTDSITYTRLKAKERHLLKRMERNLVKYRNFYASLFQEESPEYALEIQELYNFASNALSEADAKKKEEMLLYSIWMLKNTKQLESFLNSKGLKNI